MAATGPVRGRHRAASSTLVLGEPSRVTWPSAGIGGGVGVTMVLGFAGFVGFRGFFEPLPFLGCVDFLGFVDFLRFVAMSSSS
jgi:hypothetical protein